LKKAFGKWLDIETELFVDVANYSVNDRGFDPSNVSAWKDGTGAIINTDTANGLTLFHENRLVGKNILGLDLESLSSDTHYISGINSVNQVPYEIILKSDQLNSFPRKSEMHVFHLYDFLVKIHSSGIEIMGKV